MNNNMITVEIFCPEASGSYDFELDAGLKISEATERITEQIRIFEKNENILSGRKNPDVFCTGLHLPLDMEKSFDDYGIVNGCRLMII